MVQNAMMITAMASGAVGAGRSPVFAGAAAIGVRLF
jgi:hypothetical protein